MTRKPTNQQVRRAGFTLTEMLVVVGIIVIVALVAVPSFRALTGGRSTEAAHNQISAVLGRARLEAMSQVDSATGGQNIRGVMFYRDQETQRVGAILVRSVAAPPGAIPANVQIFLDLVPDRDTLLLAPDVNFQMVDDPTNTMGTPVKTDDVTDDGYIGFNTESFVTSTSLPDTEIAYGGVILFDQLGRLVRVPYALAVREIDSTTTPPTRRKTAMGQFLYPTDTAFTPNGPEFFIAPPVVGGRSFESQFGFVVFDGEAFANLGDSPKDLDADAQITGTVFANPNPKTNISELAEENWINDNAVPQLINRYNGTLLRGE